MTSRKTFTYKIKSSGRLAEKLYNQFGSIFYTHLGQHVLSMCLYCVKANAQSLSDLLARQAVGNKLQDFLFFRGDHMS